MPSSSLSRWSGSPTNRVEIVLEHRADILLTMHYVSSPISVLTIIVNVIIVIIFTYSLNDNNSQYLSTTLYVQMSFGIYGRRSCAFF